jgi:bifunctional non-homologous end joining protein LigD
MPIDWKTVKAGLDPGRFTVLTAAAMLKKSQPWKGYAQASRSLAKAIRQLTSALR